MSSHNEEVSIQETPSPEPQIPEPSLEDDEPAHEETSAEEEEEEEEEEPKSDGTVVADTEEMSGGREKLKRHRVEVAGRVWIPDMWGQEELLKDWIDCAAFDAALVSSSIIMARDSLMEERRRSANSTTLRIQN